LNEGSFPPPALPGFLGTTSPTDSPSRPAWPSQASGWSFARPRDGVSRVAPVLVVYVPSSLPRWNCWVPVALFPSSGSFPSVTARSASTSAFSRPARRLLTLQPAHSRSHLMTLSTGGFRQVVAFPPAPIATGWSDPCRKGLAPSQELCLSTAHGYGFASNPPYAPTHRDLPDRRECVRSPSLLPSHKRLRRRNQLRLKTKFRRAFNSMTPVQISAWRSAKINHILLASRLVQGAFRDRHGRGGGERWTRAIAALSGMRTNDRLADGQAVWSWRPDAGAKLAKTLHASCGRRGQKSPVPGESSE
jgi:hypothetical protein